MITGKMIFILFLVLSNLVPAQALHMLPLFLIDTDNILSHLTIPSDPLRTFNKPDFVTLLQDLKSVSNTTIIIFVEEKFCIEDITMKDKVGTPFYHLRQSLTEKKVKYIPRVFEPYKALVEVMEPENDNVFHLNAKNTQLELFNKKLPYYYVFFQDNTEATRIEKLRQHDLIMKEVYFVVRKFSNGSVVALYTGMSNPITVTHLTPKPHSAAVDTGIFKSSNVWIKLSGLQRMLNNGQRWKVMLRHKPSLSASTESDEKLRQIQANVTVSDMGLSFQFKYDDTKWTLGSVALIEANEEVGRTKVDVSAKWGQSYSCADPIAVVNLRDRSYFFISQYRIQVNRPNTRRQDEDFPPPPPPPGEEVDFFVPGHDMAEFGPAVPCTVCFNVPILTGLLITIILLSILFYGLTSIMSCNSNNRYDDPQGKVLDFTELSS